MPYHHNQPQVSNIWGCACPSGCCPAAESLSPPSPFLLDAQHGDQQLPCAHSHVLLAWLQIALVFICPGLPSCRCSHHRGFLISITTTSLLPGSLTAKPTGDALTFLFPPGSLSRVLEAQTITASPGRIGGYRTCQQMSAPNSPQAVAEPLWWVLLPRMWQL